MSRLMSVAMTADAVVERRKTVTRRAGWWEDRNGRRLLRTGDTLTLCRKVQGRRKGEPIDRLAEVQVVSVTREPLTALAHDLAYGQREVELEGFPGMDPVDFVNNYFVLAQGLDAAKDVTRISWIYLCSQCDEGAPAVEHGMCASCIHHALRSGWTPPVAAP